MLGHEIRDSSVTVLAVEAQLRVVGALRLAELGGGRAGRLPGAARLRIAAEREVHEFRQGVLPAALRGRRLRRGAQFAGQVEGGGLTRRRRPFASHPGRGRRVGINLRPLLEARASAERPQQRHRARRHPKPSAAPLWYRAHAREQFGAVCRSGREVVHQ